MDRPGKRLLVTGASGFLGWNVCRLGRSAWQVIGVVHAHHVTMEGVVDLRADLTRPEEVKRLFKTVRPDAVLHLAAASRPDFCQSHRDLSRKLNVDASIHLASLSADMDIPFVFTSSDLVFDGRSAPYGEEDPVSPVSVYGEHKVLAETGILERAPRAVICRMPLMFGAAPPASQSILQPMVRALEENGELRLFTDEYRTPLCAADAARGLFFAMESLEGGIIHLGGRERVSRFDFGRLVAEILGKEDASLIPCLQRDVPVAAPRPPDVSLDSSKAFALGFRPGSLRNELEQLLHKRKKAF